MKLHITETVRWDLDDIGILIQRPYKEFRVSTTSTVASETLHQSLEQLIHDLVRISNDNK